MKIAIPVENNSVDSGISPSFGRAPFFLIYDTDSKENSFIDNSAVASQGGAGIKAAQTLVDHGVSAMITPRCGENAARVIKAAGITIYKNINNSVQDNINAFLEGKLDVLKDIHPGFNLHGGK